MAHKRTLFVGLSDTHGGHKLGLLNPATILHQESESGELVPYTPELTAAQSYLWGLYSQHIEQVKEIAGKDRIILCHNGDITQGDRHSDGLVSTRMADQIDIGYYNLLPWFTIKNLVAARIMSGTGVHVFGEGSSELLITRMLLNLKPNTHCLHHGLLDVDGVNIDVAHHGPVAGSRYWLKGNSARFYLRDRMQQDVDMNGTPADIYLRAHYHEYIHEVIVRTIRNMDYTAHLIITPSYCMLTDYAIKVGGSPALVTNGLVVIEIVDGKVVKCHNLSATLDVRTKETL